MSAKTSPFSEFKLRVNINTSIENAYKAWTSRAGLESWFLRQAIFIGHNGNERTGDMPVQEGDSYTWRWHGYPDDVTQSGKVLKANGKNLFSFSFSLGCPVTV
jgi:uncharacterized protein YndB with AHSA1/START domain